jgi:hypothetical protein
MKAVIHSQVGERWTNLKQASSAALQGGLCIRFGFAATVCKDGLDIITLNLLDMKI